MSTLEILVALTIFTLSITAVVMVVFGNQSAVLDTEVNRTALSIAHEQLEEERALAQQDFNLVVSTTTIAYAGPLRYDAAMTVSQIDLFTKQATSTVSWEVGGRRESIILSTLFTNREAFAGADTCSSVVSGDWSHPQLASSVLVDLIATTTGPYAVSDVDVYRNKLYVTVAKTPYRTDPTFFIFDVADPSHAVLLGELDNAPASANGLAAVRVVEDPATNKTYAYAASMSSFASGQLQVFDVTDAANPLLVTTYKIPLAAVSSAGLGNAISYHNGYVYLGLSANSGDEFNIIDMRTPAVPVWRGGYDLGGHNVNAIAVRENYAYVATPAPEEVTVLTVANPSSPARVAGFNAVTGGGNGKSLYAVGTTLYLGKTVPNAGPEYYALDVSTPTNIQSAVAGAITKEVGSSVNGLIVRDYLSFTLTNSALMIIHATSTVQVALVGLPVSGSTFEPSLDCEGDTLYAASNDVSGNGSLSIFTAP